MKKIILAILAIALFSTACNKAKTTEVTNTSSPNKKARIASIEPDEVKYDYMITTVAYGLIDLSNNNEFKAILKSEIDKKFDGDDNVLLTTLNKKCNEAGINLENEMTLSLTANGKGDLVRYLHDAINGFSYFEDKIYLQVFIPFVEGKDIVHSNAPICLNFEDDAVLEGIEKVNGLVVARDVNEDYAQVNTTWVISGNESVDIRGEFTASNTIRPGANNEQKTTGVDGDVPLWINAVNISDKKEAWGNGRADLHQVTYIFRPGCVLNNDNGHNLFCKLADSDLNTWFTATFYASGLYLSLPSTPATNNTADWQPSLTEELYTIFFEHDVRKKFNRSEQISSCSQQVQYCSKESPYGIIHADYHDYIFPNGPFTTTYPTISYPLTGGQFRLIGYTLQ